MSSARTLSKSNLSPKLYQLYKYAAQVLFFELDKYSCSRFNAPMNRARINRQADIYNNCSQLTFFV